MKSGGEHEIILLGCDAALRQALVPLLQGRAARVAEEHPGLAPPSLGSGEPALVIARIRPTEDIPALAQLCGALAGRPVLALLDCPAPGQEGMTAVIAAMR